MRKRSALNLWFYIGSLLSLYGVLLTAAGVYQWFHAPKTVLPQYHATLGAGVILLLVGGVYVAMYWPFRKSPR